MIEQKLIQHIRTQFTLHWHGIHGASHWARVRANGLRLAETTGARRHVVELFALPPSSRAFKSSEEAPVPLWRGHGMHMRFTGLERSY